MLPIQIILISAIVFLAFYFYLRLRNGLLDAVLIFLFLILGVLLVSFPNFTTTMAKWLGVHRGINLVFYFTVFFFLFLILKLYARIRQLEKKFADFVRESAVISAEYLGKSDSAS